MNLLNYVLFFSFIISFSINLIQLLKTKNQPILNRSNSVELREFLSDLDSGGSMLAVKRMDPEDFLMRSPKK